MKSYEHFITNLLKNSMSREFRFFLLKNSWNWREIRNGSLNVNKLSRFFSRMLRAFLNVQNVNINISQPSENVNFFFNLFSIFYTLTLVFALQLSQFSIIIKSWMCSHLFCFKNSTVVYKSLNSRKLTHILSCHAKFHPSLLVNHVQTSAGSLKHCFHV